MARFRSQPVSPRPGRYFNRRAGLVARFPLAVAAAAAGVLAAGCATVPSGGEPQKVIGGSSQVQAYVLPQPPPPPGRTWKPKEVVLGFLHASASYAIDPSAARQYLVPSLRKVWQPGPVTVVGPPHNLNVVQAPPPHVPIRPAQLITVKFIGQRLATLSDSGQYRYTPGSPVYLFTLARVGGRWLISSLPSGLLLLTQSDFEQVYQPRNLYFFAQPQSAPSGELVPDPVYAPLQGANGALSTDLAKGLVKGLVSDQGSWLSGATRSEFPLGTKVLQLTISNRAALVNLGGAAATASPLQVQEMDDQLWATLTNSAYSQPLATRVRLEIDGKAPFIGTRPNLISPVSDGPESVFFQSGPASISELVPKKGAPPTRIQQLGPAQIGAEAITAFATSPGDGRAHLAVATKFDRGCTVYVGAAGGAEPYRGYRLSKSGGSCTSVSWDNYGNIWAVAGRQIWVLRQQNRSPMAVSPPDLPAIGKFVRILSLRMAPDAVRAALLVQTSTGNRLLLGAVSYHGDKVSFGPAITAGTGLANPSAISWYSPYDLAVLTSSGIFEVPLTGGAGQLLGPPTPDGTDSLSTNGAELVIGTESNQLWTSSGSAATWSRIPDVLTGSAPIYPG